MKVIYQDKPKITLLEFARGEIPHLRDRYRVPLRAQEITGGNGSPWRINIKERGFFKPTLATIDWEKK